MMGVETTLPSEPGLLTVKVPPEMSSVPSSPARARYEVVDAAGQAGDVQLVGVGDDGPIRASSRSTATPMFMRFLRTMRSPSHTEFSTGFLFEALDDGLHDERQVGELHASRSTNALAQRDEPTHIHLDHRPCVRGLALAGGHVVCDGRRCPWVWTLSPS